MFGLRICMSGCQDGEEKCSHVKSELLSYRRWDFYIAPYGDREETEGNRTGAGAGVICKILD